MMATTTLTLASRRRRGIASCILALGLATTSLSCSRATDWTHEVRKDEMTDGVAHVLASGSATELTWNGEGYRPHLGLRLEKGKVGVFVWTRVDPAVDQGFGPNETQNIVVRFDDEQPIALVAPVDGDKKRIGIPGTAKVLQGMLRHQRMLVKYRTMFTGGGAKEKTVEWKLDGFKAALTKMCAAEPICARETAPLLNKVLADEGIEFLGGAK
jgi:hypothetical protein